MSANCPYDDTIECDWKYRLYEFDRQLDSYAVGDVIRPTESCSCRPKLCLRYVVAQRSKQRANCPYDHTWCARKGQGSVSGKCPIDLVNCVRYQRYLNIVDKIKVNEQQR